MITFIGWINTNKKDRRGRPPLIVDVSNDNSDPEDSSAEVILLAPSASSLWRQSEPQPKQNVLSNGYAAVENKKLEEHEKRKRQCDHARNVLNRKSFTFTNPVAKQFIALAICFAPLLS